MSTHFDPLLCAEAIRLGGLLNRFADKLRVKHRAQFERVVRYY